MHYILLILLPCFLSVTSSYAASSDYYAQYAYNSAYHVEKVRYYDEYGRPVPPPRHNVDRRPAPPPPPPARPYVDRRPAPPPPSPYVDTRPAPPPPGYNVDRRPAPAPTYNVDVRPAPPPPPKR